MERLLFSANASCVFQFTTARYVLIASLVIGLQGLAPPSAQAQPDFVTGEILVKYAPGVSKNEIAELNASHGTHILEMIPELGIYRLSIPANKAESAMINGYTRNPRVKYAEPNYIGKGGDFFPTDTFFFEQWHLHNLGYFGIPDADIDAVEGWQITRGDASVTVAVLDSGIDFNHPEFAGRVLPGFDVVDDDNDPTFDHPHGVWVTGIIAANADNLSSVAGVDHFAQILPVKVLNSRNRGSTMDLAQGLVFAANQGADVINMSLIDYPPAGQTLSNALQFARDAGSILIACAGNFGIDDADFSAPGKSPLTISVGATNSFDFRADFSGTGSALDVVAPGVDVVTVDPFFYGDSLNFFSGCSAATPVVAGIASLLLSINPLLTHDQVLGILTQTADDLVGLPFEDTPGRDDFMGHGRVNMNQSLILAGSMALCGNGSPDPGEECDDGNVIGGDGCSPICQIEGQDADGDGVPDEEDACPNSILDPTVVIDGCDSQVSNALLSEGCTISDEIEECGANANKHGAFRRCVSKLGDSLQKDGVLTGPEKDEILSCAGQADIP
jgi:thermitase